MSDKKKTRSDTARRIWLAGIGAYGRAFTEAQETLKELSGEASTVFDDLVQKGEMIELTVDAKRKELTGKAGMPDVKMPDLKMPDLGMEDRIAKMRSRLTGASEVASDLSDMDTRLSAIEAKLDKILAHLDTPKKPAPKKKTTARKPKPKT